MVQFLEPWNFFLKTPIRKAIYFFLQRRTPCFFSIFDNSKGVQYRKSTFHSAILRKQTQATSPGLYRQDIMEFPELLIINTSSEV